MFKMKIKDKINKLKDKIERKEFTGGALGEFEESMSVLINYIEELEKRVEVLENGSI